MNSISTPRQTMMSLVSDWSSPATSRKSARQLLDLLLSTLAQVAPSLSLCRVQPMSLGGWRAPFRVNDLIAANITEEVIHVYACDVPAARISSVTIRRAVFTAFTELDLALVHLDLAKLERALSPSGSILAAIRLLQVLDGLLPIRTSEAGPGSWDLEEPRVLTLLGPRPESCLYTTNPGGGTPFIASLTGVPDDIVGSCPAPIIIDVGADSSAWFTRRSPREGLAELK